MTNQQGVPEALRLADALECRTTSWPDKVFAAAELRRLRAENVRLQQELIRESRRTAEQKLRADQMTRQLADQADRQPAPVLDYPPLPDFDSGNEPIWKAIFNWKAATPGADASRKANKIESAIIDQLRAYADETYALRSPQARSKVMTEPTDAELIALLGDRQFSTIGAVREALRRWGTPPAVAGEPVPLTPFISAQRERLFYNRPKNVSKGATMADWHRVVQYIEAAHGIKGGQK